MGDETEELNAPLVPHNLKTPVLDALASRMSPSLLQTLFLTPIFQLQQPGILFITADLPILKALRPAWASWDHVLLDSG